MLFPQIPDILKDVNAELKGKLPFIEATIKTETNTPDLISKLTKLTNYIDSKYDIGTIEYPGEWVFDTLTVKQVKTSHNPHLFALVGKVSEEHYVLIGGTSNHIIGNEKNGAEVKSSTSYLPFLAKALYEEFEELETDQYTRHMWTINDHPLLKPKLGTSAVEKHHLALIVSEFYHNSEGIEMNIQFLGRHLRTENMYGGFEEYYKNNNVDNPRRSSIFTPLYIKLI